MRVADRVKWITTVSINTGIPYELLAQSIFQEMHDTSGAKTIDVQRDVKIQGKSAVHQIDVYWKFGVGGIEYQALVQAKDYASNIEQEAVFAFNCVLDDIPGQPRGIMVTRTGFQTGAQAYAKHHGIKLYLLRDWHRSYTISDISYAKYFIDEKYTWRVIVYRPEVHHLNFHFFVPSPSSPKKLPRDFPRQFSKMHLLDGNGAIVGTVADILRGYIGTMRAANTLNATVRHDFSEPTYIRFSPRSARLSHLSAFECVITLIPEPQPPVPLLPSGVVQFILKDVHDGTSKFFQRPR